MGTYYVATAGSSPPGSDANAGTIAAPWLTLAYAVAHITSGDTLYLRGGTWSGGEQLRIFYRGFTSLVTIKAYTGETPIIDMEGVVNSDYSACSIYVIGTDYVRFEGLTCRNSAHCGIYFVGADNSAIVNNIIEHSLYSNIHVGLSQNVTVTGNRCRWPCDYAKYGTASEEPISITASCVNVEVAYNYMTHGSTMAAEVSGGEGINVKEGCSYIYVHHNVVDQTRDDAVTPYKYCFGVDAWDVETHHIYFYDNVAINGRYGYIVEAEKTGACHDVWVYNNVAYNCGLSSEIGTYGGGYAIPGWDSDGGEPSPGPKTNIYFYNNTCYNCRWGFQIWNSNITAPIVCRNNIFANNVSGEVDYAVGVPTEEITYSNNLASGTFDFDDPTSASLSLTFPFGTVSVNDYHIGASSDAIGAGAVVSGGASSPYTDVTVDFDDVARGAAFDAGAYEYGSALPVGTPVLSIR